MKKGILILLSIVTVFFAQQYLSRNEGKVITKENNDKKAYQHFDGPAKFSKIENYIRTRADQSAPSYKMGYTYNAYKQAIAQVGFRGGPIDWIERGPNNVGGRTRALVFDPADGTHQSWYAGSVGGGVWKTVNAGNSWTNLTPNLANLATSTIAISDNNPDVIYVGTGEGYDDLMVTGAGIWKSIDKGQTWNVLASTINNSKFANVLRLIVNPENENELVACTVNSFQKADGGGSLSYIFRSSDGGENWTESYNTENNPIQQIVADPGEFKTIYASENGSGILKSSDSGENWVKVFDVENLGVRRMELAVSPKKAATIFVACETEDGSVLYITRNGFGSTNKALVSSGSQPNWLGSQGWYDNAIAAHPYDVNKVWVAGSGSILEFDVSEQLQDIVQLISSENNTSFLESVEESQIPADGQGLAQPLLTQFLLSAETTPAEMVDVEVRFGPGIMQKAHLLNLDQNTFELSFGSMIDVPFEAWDIENNKQITLSIIDVNEDGKWTFGTAVGENIQDVVFIHVLDYSGIPDPKISGNNPAYKAMFQFNLQKQSDYAGDETNFPTSNLSYDVGTVQGLVASFQVKADGYYEFAGDSKGVHVDHHFLALEPVDEATGNFYVLNGNDGGVAFSNDKGATFKQTGDTFNGEGTYTTSTGYNVSQFYGADKMNGADRYIGGTQDNGSWISPTNWTADGKWKSAPSGDGFEAAWNYGNTNLILESSQGNSISKSTNGGASWATVELPESSGPFVTRIASSQLDPDLVFVCSDLGVIKSTDFGDSWEVKNMPDSWQFSFFGPPIKISLADANVVWTGSGIGDNTRIALSKDKGETWAETANYLPMNMGRITGLATDPKDSATAYALFSQADGPKVLKTIDWGQTWIDISGFGSGADVSANGFPDVATYSLLVMPFDVKHIWAGTEIGLFESLDGGTSWAYADNGFPSVGIWQMKIVNDQIIMATHGRGIWTVKLSEVQGPDATSTTINSDNNLTISPNPLVDISNITFSTEYKQKVSINLFSSNGKQIKTLFEGQLKGEQAIQLEKNELPSGLYFVNMNTEEGLITKKLLIQ